MSNFQKNSNYSILLKNEQIVFKPEKDDPWIAIDKDSPVIFYTNFTYGVVKYYRLYVHDLCTISICNDRKLEKTIEAEPTFNKWLGEWTQIIIKLPSI